MNLSISKISSPTRSFVRVLGVLLLGVVAACSQDASDEDQGAAEGALTGGGEMAPEVDDAIARVPWQPVGNGVSYKPVDPAQSNVLIIFGGYSGQEKWVQRWCDETIRVKNDLLGVGHLYAVKGPDDASYKKGEIENSKLVAHLAAESRAKGAAVVTVIAHSSGTYVADELFANMKKGTGNLPADTVGKVEYFNLDGGGPADPALVKRFAHVHFVWAHDAKIKADSHNASGMKSLGSQYTAQGGGVQVDADGSGCDGSNGLWCMHDALINTRPHNPRMFDLVHDYTDFAPPRKLVTSYLDSLSPPQATTVGTTAGLTAEPEGDDP
jgi:hypothetical protein